MRIALVNYAYDAEVADPEALLDRYDTLTGWAEALVGAGARSVVVAQRFSRDADLERRGVRYALRRDDGPPVATGRTEPTALHALLEAERPDIVHVNGLMFPAQLVQLRAALGPTSRIAVQDHAGLAPPGRRWWEVVVRVRRGRLRRGLATADALLFTSREQAVPWRRAGILTSSARVFEVPESSTTLTPVSRDEGREATGIRGHPAALWVGRLTLNKDPLTVLDGVERAAAVVPDLGLAMVFRDDDLLPAVRARIARSAVLSARVQLVGAVPHTRMSAYYSAADLFVLGSHAEGSGYALIEALACGCVPVVTDIPSFRALVAPVGLCDLLWTPGDAWTLARAFVRCAHLDFTEARREIRARFEAHLSWAAVGRRAMEIYHAVRREARTTV